MAMAMRKTFKGANVFMSRNLVPPEIFDSLHDALKLNGATVLLCCDPSRNGPDDYHIISSRDHEKFDDLREKGCNLLGPQCVLSCANEHRLLPKQGFTCCLAMDGVKVLASGFDLNEKAEIEKLVTAMGGVLYTRVSSDVSFVIVKNVLAAKYKWALNVLKKPIITLRWLQQCWKEHRLVPHEPYRVLPFSGLTIAITNFRADERREIEKLVTQNGGTYSADLHKKCTHLVCDIPEGDKFKFAKKFGDIHIVNRKWLDQSVARRACLNEGFFPVQLPCGSSMNTIKTASTSQHNQEKLAGSSHCAASSVGTNILSHAAACDGMADVNPEATLSQNLSSVFSDGPCSINIDNGPPTMRPDMDLDLCVANDSQNEDSFLYLSECRIFLVGFDASEMRGLVHMVRRGGGSRYLSLDEKLTHIVVGAPSESEKKEVRGFYNTGVLCVSKLWLEDCDRDKKESPVLQRHTAYSLLLPKDSTSSNKGVAMGLPGLKQGKSSTQSILQDDQFQKVTSIGLRISSEKSKKSPVHVNPNASLKGALSCTDQSQFLNLNSCDKDQLKAQHGLNNANQDNKLSSVFRGRLFRFSDLFPYKKRQEVIEWIHNGGGEVVDDKTRKDVQFTVASHGLGPRPSNVSDGVIVSTHWVRFCSQEGQLLDVESHILFSPLQCQIPLPAFENLRLCASQYDEMDKLLLKNLCFVLGCKFVRNLTKKVTHLLCKFACGIKYEKALEWGVQTVTFDWILECVKQNGIVDTGAFSPKVVTMHDREAGLCITSQYPSQADRMISTTDDSSQLTSQTQDLKSVPSQVIDSRSDDIGDEAKFSNMFRKRARLLEDNGIKGSVPSVEKLVDPACISAKNKHDQDSREVSNQVAPDFAAAIDDLLLLEETSKIHDQKSVERTESEKILFTSDCSMIGQPLLVDPHSASALSKNWIQRTNKINDVSKPSGNVQGDIYDGFSETQTESQVVGYEEDLSGRQMIIERARTRSGLTPNC